MNNVEGANGELRRGEGGEERGGVEERRRVGWRRGEERRRVAGAPSVVLRT